MSGELNHFARMDRIRGYMRFRKAGLFTALVIFLVLLWLSGCAEQPPELIGPMTRDPSSNTTISGYTRAGVMFGR
jgi:hypothetical protein